MFFKVSICTSIFMTITTKSSCVPPAFVPSRLRIPHLSLIHPAFASHLSRVGSAAGPTRDEYETNAECGADSERMREERLNFSLCLILYASLSCHVQSFRFSQSSLMSAAEKRTIVLLSAILIIGFVYYSNRDVSNQAQLWKFYHPERPDVLKRK